MEQTGQLILKKLHLMKQNMTLQSEDSKMHDLFKAIYLGDDKSIEDAVSKEIEKLHKNANTVSQYNLVIMEMVGAFYRFCANNFIDFNDFLGDINNPYEGLSDGRKHFEKLAY